MALLRTRVESRSGKAVGFKLLLEGLGGALHLDAVERQQGGHALPRGGNQVAERHPGLDRGVDLIVDAGFDIVGLGQEAVDGGAGDLALEGAVLERMKGKHHDPECRLESAIAASRWVKRQSYLHGYSR